MLENFNIETSINEEKFYLKFIPLGKTDFLPNEIEISKEQYDSLKYYDSKIKTKISCFKFASNFDYMLVKPDKNVDGNLKIEITPEQYEKIKDGLIIKDGGREFWLGYL